MNISWTATRSPANKPGSLHKPSSANTLSVPIGIGNNNPSPRQKNQREVQSSNEKPFGLSRKFFSLRLRIFD